MQPFIQLNNNGFMCIEYHKRAQIPIQELGLIKIIFCYLPLQIFLLFGFHVNRKQFCLYKNDDDAHIFNILICSLLSKLVFNQNFKHPNCTLLTLTKFCIYRIFLYKNIFLKYMLKFLYYSNLSKTKTPFCPTIKKCSFIHA